MNLTLRSVLGALAVLILVACASTPKAIDGLFPELEQKALDLNNGGTVAALGIGIDLTGRFDFASQKAQLDGRAKVAQQYESTINGLVNQFAETLNGSTSAGTETNETFKTAVSNVFKRTLNGVRALTTSQQIKEKGKLTVGVVMGVDAKLLNTTLLDEVKSVDPKLYERFRSSQAFEELKKATEALDKK